MCNANLIFRDVIAKWPGSHHDSFILEASTVHDGFESGEFGNCWLLGDSGYPLNSLVESAIHFHFWFTIPFVLEAESEDVRKS